MLWHKNLHWALTLVVLISIGLTQTAQAKLLEKVDYHHARHADHEFPGYSSYGIEEGELQERASKYCTKDKMCKSYQWCSRKKCVVKLDNGQRCARDSSCSSNSCDVITKKCQSHWLSNGSTCASSMACRSGNCFHSKCAPKVAAGSYCYKDQNCQAGLECHKKAKMCVPSEKSPLHPTIPWNKDLKDLQNLKPSENIQLFYTDAGHLDYAVVGLMAAMNSTTRMPSVVLSHSSWVGQVSCAANDKVVVPFTSNKAYKFVKLVWKANSDFLLVTHTHGCSSEVHNSEERTFWVANGLQFNDAKRTVTVNAKQVAIEEAIDEIEITYGQSNPNPTDPTQPGTTTTVTTPGPTSTADATTTTATTTTATTTTSADPPVPTDTGDAAEDPDFDRKLDDALGYYDFDNDFSNSLQQFIPGLPSYDEAEYIDSDFLQTRGEGDALARMLQRRWGFSKIFKAVTTVVKAVVTVQKAIITTVAKVAVPVLKVAAKVLSYTPVGILIDAVLSAWTPSISGRIPITWQPLKLFESPWEMQTRLLHVEGKKSSTKENDPHTAALIKAKGKPKAEASVSGSLDVFCVDCYFKGAFSYGGSLGFSLREARVTKCTVDYGSSIDLQLQWGLSAKASAQIESKKELATFPLPGGFAIKNVITVGPAIRFEARATLQVDAEADLLVGISYSSSSSHHLDLVNPKNSKSTAVAPQTKVTKEAKGSLLAKFTLGLPVSLVLGLDVVPLKEKKEVALTMEPALIAAAMTASDEDMFEGEKMEACTQGMAYKVGTGLAFSLNLWDWSTYDLKKINGPQLAQGCLDFGLGGGTTPTEPTNPTTPTEPTSLSTDAKTYCPQGDCTCTVSGMTVSCKYTGGSSETQGLSSSFVAPCTGTSATELAGGMGGWNYAQGYRRSGYIAKSQLSTKVGTTYTVQVGGRGGVTYIDGNNRGGWPNGGDGTPDDYQSGGGGGSSEIKSSTGERLVVAGGGGGNGWGGSNWPGWDVDQGQLTGSEYGGASAGGQNGGGGGGLQGGNAGTGDQGGYAGSSKGDSIAPADAWIMGYVVITHTCAAK